MDYAVGSVGFTTIGIRANDSLSSLELAFQKFDSKLEENFEKIDKQLDQITKMLENMLLHQRRNGVPLQKLEEEIPHMESVRVEREVEEERPDVVELDRDLKKCCEGLIDSKAVPVLGIHIINPLPKLDVPRCDGYYPNSWILENNSCDNVKNCSSNSDGIIRMDDVGKEFFNYMSVKEIGNCSNWVSSVAVSLINWSANVKNRGSFISREIRIIELGWWVKGKCYCNPKPNDDKFTYEGYDPGGEFSFVTFGEAVNQGVLTVGLNDRHEEVRRILMAVILDFVGKLKEIDLKIEGVAFLDIAKKITGPGVKKRAPTQHHIFNLGDTSPATLPQMVGIFEKQLKEKTGMNFELGMGSALETLCGQAFGAGQIRMLGVYMQRSWVILMVTACALLPLYIFAPPILMFLGESAEISRAAGKFALWMIPQMFAYAVNFPTQKFLQSQRKLMVMAWISLGVLVLHIFFSWLFILKLEWGLVGAAVTLNTSWWLIVILQLVYIFYTKSDGAWSGFSWLAFQDLYDFVKLSLASAIMLCLEFWYLMILLVIAGYLDNPVIPVDDAFSICMNIGGSFRLRIYVGTDFDDWKPQKVPSGHLESMSGISCARGTEYLLSVSHDQTCGRFFAWSSEEDQEAWHEIARLKVHDHDLNSVTIIRGKGNHIFVSGSEEKVSKGFEASLSFLETCNHAASWGYIFTTDLPLDILIIVANTLAPEHSQGLMHAQVEGKLERVIEYSGDDLLGLWVSYRTHVIDLAIGVGRRNVRQRRETLASLLSWLGTIAVDMEIIFVWLQEEGKSVGFLVTTTKLILTFDPWGQGSQKRGSIVMYPMGFAIYILCWGYDPFHFIYLIGLGIILYWSPLVTVHIGFNRAMNNE